MSDLDDVAEARNEVAHIVRERPCPIGGLARQGELEDADSDLVRDPRQPRPSDLLAIGVTHMMESAQAKNDVEVTDLNTLKGVSYGCDLEVGLEFGMLPREGLTDSDISRRAIDPNDSVAALREPERYTAQIQDAQRATKRALEVPAKRNDEGRSDDLDSSGCPYMGW